MGEITNNVHSAKGVIYKIYETEHIQTKKGIMEKKLIVIEASSLKGGWNRTSFHALESFGDQCAQYGYYKVGDSVDYQYRAESRMTDKNGTERWFTSLYLVSMGKKFLFDGPGEKPNTTDGQKPISEEPKFSSFDPHSDDLPF